VTVRWVQWAAQPFVDEIPALPPPIEIHINELAIHSIAFSYALPIKRIAGVCVVVEL
jgi:hypothetical protein